MALLSNIFGNGDSENSNSSDLLNILDATASIDASHTSYSQSVDEDGNSDTSYHNSEFGTDLDIGSVLSNMTDSFHDGDSGGGIFG